MDLGSQILFKTAITAHREGNFTRAQALYEEVLRRAPHQPEVAYNLALLHISQENTQPAIRALEKVLDINPGHVDALNNLGALLLKVEQLESALQCFSAVLTISPDHLEARNNVAATLLQLDRYFHAAQHYQFLLEKTPDDIGARYSYGVALLESDDLQEAIHQFERVLTEKPNHLNAKTNLGIAYLKQGNTDKAKTIFNKVLAENPNRPEIAYLYRALTGEEAPDKPPKEYIQHLFDQYAKNYELHMVDTLAYEAPQKLRELLDKHFEINHLKIADLGCGTGLSGVAFKSYASLLHGVDLSPKMLTLAKHKAIYHKLFEMDLCDFLNQAELPYDLLLAVDTLNYLGDLTPVFHGAHHALTPTGLILFSVEEGEHESAWQLQKSGRYTHHRNYVRHKAAQHGFEIVGLEKSALRRQNHEPVMGWLCLLQRKSST